MYGYETPRYAIPAQVVGDFIEGQEEQRTFNIIDTQLYGLMRSNNRGHGVIATGQYVATYSAGNNSFVTFSEDKPAGKWAVEALINQVYVGSINPFTFNGIPDNTTSYLFIRLIEEDTGRSSVEQAEFTTYVSSSSTPPDDGILIATADTTGGTITVDDAPSGRINIPILADHVNDNTDPHGSLLIQTNLIVEDDLISSGTAVFTTVDAEVISGNEAYFREELSGTGVFHANALVISGGAYWQGDINVIGNINFPSGITFAQNISVESGVTVDGRDISADGATLDSHLVDYDNPHQVTAEQTSGISKFGGLLEGNLEVQSGKTIDGVDVSTLTPLIAGGDASSLHSHTGISPQSGIRVFKKGVEYSDAVLSGEGIGLQTKLNDTPFMNIYEIQGIASGISVGIINVCQPLPTDLLAVPNDFLTLYAGVQSGTSNRVEVFAKDSNNDLMELTNDVFTDPTLTEKTVSFSGVPAFAQDGYSTVQLRAEVESGTTVQIGDYGFKTWRDFSV